MNITPFPEGFETNKPTTPISEIPISQNPDPVLKMVPLGIAETTAQMRLVRSLPRDYIDRVEEIKTRARDFTDRHIRPNALEIEANVTKDTTWFAWDMMKKACDYGFFSLIIPKQFGGGGYGVLHMAVMAEELAVGCAGLASTIGVHSAGISCGMIAVDAYILEKYIRPVVEAEKRGKPLLWSGAVTEPNAGTDIWDEEFISKGKVGTFAKRTNDGWVLNGRKVFISNGSVSKYTVIAAATDPTRPGDTWTAFLVPTDTKGFSVGRIERKMGQKSSPAAEQILDDVFVDKSLQLGIEGHGARYVSIYLAGSRGPVGAIGVGCARRALECLIDWGKSKRDHGGRLIDQQALQMEIAAMSMKIVNARQAYVASSIGCDHIIQGILENPMVKIGLALAPGAFLGSNVGQAILQSGPMKNLMARLLKYYCPLDRLNHISALATTAKVIGSNAGVEVTGRVMEIMGPDAYDERWPVDKCYRDAKLNQIYEGTNGANTITHFKSMVGLMDDSIRPNPTLAK